MLFNVLMFINGYFGILTMLELVGGQASGNYSRPHPTSYLYLCMCVCAFVYIYMYLCVVYLYMCFVFVNLFFMSQKWHLLSSPMVPVPPGSV